MDALEQLHVDAAPQRRLEDAAFQGNRLEIRRALDDGATVSFWLLEECLQNRACNPQRALQSLIKEGVNVADITDDNGKTALHVCPKRCVRILIDAGVNVNAADRRGFTPLHSNISECLRRDRIRPYDTMKKLLQEGADIFARNNDDETPFDLAMTIPTRRMSVVPEQFYHFHEYEDYRRKCVTHCILKAYSNRVVEQEGDNAMHAILEAATFNEGESLDEVQLPLGNLGAKHMYSLLEMVSFENSSAISALPPLAVASSMDVPVYIIEFLLYSEPTCLAHI